MYFFTDIPMLLETINNHQDQSLTIVIDENVLNSDLVAIPIFKPHHNLNLDIKAVFTTIYFLKEHHAYDRELNNIYMMIGRISERQIMKNEDTIDMLASYLHMYVTDAYRIVLDKSNPTVRDVLNLYNVTIYPIKNTEEEKKLD